mmetsp:Transcript_63795/g.201794  ORF Transcript_63795/g.201794 Transcript_63795/m.201794 type:complete len:425 (+) Transcript_63795:1631-2905(+)
MPPPRAAAPGARGGHVPPDAAGREGARRLHVHRPHRRVREVRGRGEGPRGVWLDARSRGDPHGSDVQQHHLGVREGVAVGQGGGDLPGDAGQGDQPHHRRLQRAAQLLRQVHAVAEGPRHVRGQEQGRAGGGPGHLQRAHHGLRARGALAARGGDLQQHEGRGDRGGLHLVRGGHQRLRAGGADDRGPRGLRGDAGGGARRGHRRVHGARARVRPEGQVARRARHVRSYRGGGRAGHHLVRVVHRGACGGGQARDGPRGLRRRHVPGGLQDGLRSQRERRGCGEHRPARAHERAGGDGGVPQLAEVPAPARAQGGRGGRRLHLPNHHGVGEALPLGEARVAAQDGGPEASRRRAGAAAGVPRPQGEPRGDQREPGGHVLVAAAGRGQGGAVREVACQFCGGEVGPSYNVHGILLQGSFDQNRFY